MFPSRREIVENHALLANQPLRRLGRLPAEEGDGPLGLGGVDCLDIVKVCGERETPDVPS